MNLAEIVALRRKVAADDVPSPSDQIEVAYRAGNVLNHVRVRLVTPSTLDDLALEFGPAQELPMLPSGARRALFPDTLPGDGERSITVLAELDRVNRVTAVVLRPDDFR
jgi:hypothetical protein